MSTRTYGFIGLGLIGGSLAVSLRKQEPECRIYVYSRTRTPLEGALAEGKIDLILDSPADPAFAECDLIFLCAPVSTNIAYLQTLKTVLSPKTLLTDVGSVKSGIHKAIEELGLSAQFIGGHPMTGSEKTGLANATDHLFENAYYILTPTKDVPQEWVEMYQALVSSIGALPLIIDCKEHDFVTAAISHLPHMIASALVNTVHDLDSPQEHMKLMAAGGFKDITRIASSSPEMWEAICVDNQANISKVCDEFIRQLTEAQEHMNESDGAYINAMFDSSRSYRNSFSERSLGPIKKLYRIYCDIIDESGAIATIATILSVNGISIKNIGIVHNREFEEGALSIEFYEEEPARQAAQVLRSHRYQVWERL